MFNAESVQVLINLGLSKLQADIYLALCNAGQPVTIKAVSKAALVARQDAYRLMPSLEKMGLVEKVLAKPMLYKATPIKDGCRFLLDIKLYENSQLEKNTLALINSFQQSAYQSVSSEDIDEPQFLIINSEKLLKRRFDENDKTVCKSLDAIVDWNFLRFRLNEHFEDYDNALKRGVRVRMLTHQHEADNITKRIIMDLLKYPFFEIRCFNEVFPAPLVIHDALEVTLNVDNPPQNLVSTNPQFVKVIEDYFENLWKKSENYLLKENHTPLRI